MKIDQPQNLRCDAPALADTDCPRIVNGMDTLSHLYWVHDLRPISLLKSYLLAILLSLGISHPVAAQVQRIWLTHRSNAPSHLVVNWETAQPGNSVVRYGTTPQLEHTSRQDDHVTLHHVEIDLPAKAVKYYYQVESGVHTSAVATFKGYPTNELRVAVVADWGYAKPDLTALRRDDPHLLLSAGDSVPSLHQFGRPGEIHATQAFSALIDAAPELFRSTPFLPVLGNHDKEIRPRGPKPPPAPVYDINATAYREFFPLPGDEWKWAFDVPEFDVRFIALDLQHISDMGTTWQACHPFGAGSEQFIWYRHLMTTTRAGFVVTLMNERNATMRAQAGGAWGEQFQKGSLVASGFGYFAERAEVNGFPYFNTALKGDGDRYPDPHSAFFAGEDNYLLLTLHRGSPSMTVELKNLKGAVLDRREIQKR